MTLELRVRGRAKADIQRAVKWYERQREGLGKQFVAEVDAALERIEANPEQYQILHRNIRRAITHHFPYGVFYRIRGNTINIFAVVHLLPRRCSLDNVVALHSGNELSLRVCVRIVYRQSEL